MKKYLLCFIAGAVIIGCLSSCSATKRDCTGVKHYKQKGGFYL